MAKRTQGSWEARPHQFGGCWWVETLDGSIQVSMQTSNNNEANARFIAAAPDMEKALEGFLRMSFENLNGQEAEAIIANGLAALPRPPDTTYDPSYTFALSRPGEVFLWRMVPPRVDVCRVFHLEAGPSGW